MVQGCLSSVSGSLTSCFALDMLHMILIKDSENGIDFDFGTDGSEKGEEKWQIRFYSRWITRSTR
jgi:hypothetical protein